MAHRIDPIRAYHDVFSKAVTARCRIEGLKSDARRILAVMDATPAYFRFAQLDATGLPALGFSSIVYPAPEEWPTATAFQQAFVDWHAAAADLTAAWNELSPDDQRTLRGADPANAGAPILR